MPHARPLSKTYYWIDYKEFCDVVRWRMDTLYKSLDKKLRTEQENKGYICSNPTCRRTYLPVDIPINFSPEGNLLCDNCGWELEDNDEQEDVKGSEDKMAMFNSQTAWIQEGLRKTSEMIFPVFDIQEWLAANTRGGVDAEIVSATSVQVELQLDGDDAKKASERAKVIAEQRTQNVIPSWHLFSTVSGQRTALGITHAAQESSKAGMSYSNDDNEVQVVDEKGVEALDDYYTNLRAQASNSTSDPSSSSFLVKPEPTSDDEDAFNPNGKRARTQSSPPPPPAPEPNHADSSSTGSDPKRARTSGSPAGEGTGGGEEKMMVSVDGVQMAFDDVTEDHQEKMTPDEYTAYFEVWSEINS